MNFYSLNPATGAPVWSGPAATSADVDSAVARARAAFPAWSRRTLAERTTLLRAYAARLTARKAELAALISQEVGKPDWEALTEVQSMIGKVELSIEAHTRRCADFTGGPAVARFRPHGVVAVFGPFNFPGHLPNGHLVPALLAGNTALFKPSEHAPAVAELTRTCWLEAGLPADVLQVVQGARATGEALAAQPDIDGLFFTGGSTAGAALSAQFASTPGKILALELGGNNPLVVWHPRDVPAAALMVLQSAFLSAGQRCTCARRLILPADATGDALLAGLIALIARVRVGPATDRPEPFHGPVISAAAAARVLDAQEALIATGATALVPVTAITSGGALLRPGLLDVTAVPNRADEEIFGPLLQVIRVPDFDAALAEANHTRFGLAAGLIADDPALFARFRDTVRAGIVNWNQALTGASGAVPFGGIGASGNHRPSGFFAADYCCYVVAGIETPELKLPAQLPPGLNP
jgi:succinylglutamic semialdehyde dehydrogenase